MRGLALGIVSVVAVATCAYLSARPDNPVKLRLRLVDAKTGNAIAGVVRVTPQGQENPVELAGLYPRLRGLKVAPAVAGWHVVPAAGADTTLPPARVRVEAFSGLETGVAKLEADLRK